MWMRIKKVSNLFFRVCLAIVLIAFMFLVFTTMLSKDLSQNTQIITFI